MLPSVVLAVALSAWSEPLEVSGAIDGRAGTGSLRVYLPAGYSPEKKYPLVIALHGWDHSPELFKSKSDLASLADQYGLVIAAPSMGKTVYETRFYPETKGEWTTAPGTRWVAEVILPYLRHHFAVWEDRAHTAVIGYSTGGRGAVLLAEAYPEFAFAGSLSGTYDMMTLKPAEGEYKIHAVVYGARDAFKERWQLDNCVAPARLAKLRGTRLFIAHGAKDRVVTLDQLEALRSALKGSGAEAELVVAPEGGHDWSFWNSQWGRLFEVMTKALGPRP